jgi:plasmid stabilization system protein ParE
MKLTFHHLVQHEVNDAVRWYEEQSEGLGDDFFAKFESALNAIQLNPSGYAFWLESNTVRRAKLKRFPYAVLYKVYPDKVRILCVRHDKKHPRYGMAR